MKNQILAKSSFWGKMTFAILMLMCAATLANAQGITFAQFTQRPVNQQTLRDFVLDNNGTSATFRTVSGGTPIRFEYQNVNGLPAELAGQQNATISVSCTTTAPASQTFGTMRLQQPFNQTCTIQISRDAPTSAGIGSGSRTNLLTAVVTTAATSPVLAGEEGSNSAGFTASTPDQNIIYTSDFISFNNDPNGSRNLALALSAISPGLSIGPGGFLNSFIANAAGTFASSTTPVFFTPTASSVTISGRVLTRKGTGVGNTRVTMTTLSGETFTTVTNNFGYYSFGDVLAGDTVVISVRSKRESYAAQTITVGEDAVGLNFSPQ